MEEQRPTAGIVQVFVKEAIRACTWGAVLVIVFFICMAGLRYNIKKTIDFSMKAAVMEVKDLAADKQFTHSIKQNLKEGVEFASKAASQELKRVMNDGEFQQNIKDAIDFWYGYEYKARQPASHQSEVQK